MKLRQDGLQPLEVKVCAGDVLYIPACWWHEIHHGPTDEMTISVNYWYDMLHDVKFSSMLLVDRLAEELGVNESLCHDD
jgi:ribosomal protein L16 Arg81 hydroxylase